MSYLILRVKFEFDDIIPDLVTKLHEVYKAHGFSYIDVDCDEDEDISYEKACEVNQYCYDNNITFDNMMYYRMYWACDWISSAETMQSIELYPYDENTYYSKQKEEWVLFPEDESYKVLAEVFSLANDLYLLDFVRAVELEKEE